MLASSTDGVGTKIRIAEIMGRYDTVGQDLVNHCVNDILTTGAEPLFLLDYIGSSLLPDEVKLDVVRGLKTACDAHECVLIGGETADMPDVYAAGDFDLVGFIVGVVERDACHRWFEDPRRRRAARAAGDGAAHQRLLARAPHLRHRRRRRRDADRAALDTRYEDLGSTLGDALLAIHRSYYHELKPVLGRLHGIAHITGGGSSTTSRASCRRGSPRNSIAAPGPCRRSSRSSSSAVPCPTTTCITRSTWASGIVLAVAPDETAAIAAQIPDAMRVGTVVRQAGERRVIIE